MKKRIISILLVLVMTVSLLPQLVFVADAEDSDVEIARWSGFRKTAVCFTFDDGATEQASHCTSIAPAFDKYGYKATFYVVTNWMDSMTKWAEYKKLANNGHEIGSHSVTHTNSSNNSELNTSKRIIEENIEKPCLTYSYVNGLVPYGTMVLNYYIAAREIGDGLNRSSNPDCGRINSQILGSEGLNTKTAITGKIQNAIDSDQWVTFVGHGIQGVTTSSSYSRLSYDALTESLDWIHEHDNEVWATSLCNAVMYLKERDDATFEQTSATDSELTYSLTLSSELTADPICEWNYPLSLRISLPGGWETVSVTQDGKTLDSYIKEGKIYFDAVPNGGEIVVYDDNEVTTPPVFEFTTQPQSGTAKKSEGYSFSWTISDTPDYYNLLVLWDDSWGGTGDTYLNGSTGTVPYVKAICTGNTSKYRILAQKGAQTIYSDEFTVTWTDDTTYTVTFDANGGGVMPTSAVTGTDGKLATLPTPTRDWASFDGWYTESNGGTKVTLDTVYTANTTIYAHWVSGGSTYALSCNVYSFGNANLNTTVQLFDSERRSVYKTVSASGELVHYDLMGVNAGNYCLVVSKPGYATRYWPVTVEENAVNANIEIDLLGDVVCDCEFTAADYSAAVNIALSDENYVTFDQRNFKEYKSAIADMDEDGYVDVLDVVEIERLTHCF